MNIETKRVKLSQIKLNPDNPRRISEKDMERLVKSLTEFPEMMDIREIVVDENFVCMGGNMRTLALRKAGAKECVAKVVTGLTKEQKREFVIKDNGSMGEWDFDLLSGWDDLPLADWGVDLPEDWLKNTDTETPDAEPQIDKAAELNKIWKVKTGDLWQVGDHRLLCGDSTNTEDVARVMGGEKAVLCISDPPYNYDYQYSSLDDNLDEEAFIKFTNTWFFIARQFASVRIVTPGLKNLSMFLKNYGATWICAWVKKNAMTASKIGNLSVWEPVVFDADDCDWEPVIVYGKPRKKVKRDVYEYPVKVQRDTANHPCPKLIEFWAKLVQDFSKPTDIVMDVFLGSGTTMVACQNLNRKCRGLELGPEYCAVILQRMTDAFPGIEIRRINA